MSRILLLLCLFALAGCGAAPRPKSESPAPADQGGARPEAKEAAGERKLIFRAYLDVVVHDMTEAVGKLDAAVAAHKGYVAKSELRGNAAGRGYGTFVLRVPAENLRPLLADLKALGTAERDALESDDVTEEFRDVQTQVKNMKAEEETLNRLMREKAGSVEDVLKVRQQIQPLREKIERAEGRFEYLSKMTALSTVNLTLREIKDYKPAPTTFNSRAGQSFSKSVENLVQFFEGVALAAVATAPWLPVVLPVLIVAVVWRRRRRAKT